MGIVTQGHIFTAHIQGNNSCLMYPRSGTLEDSRNYVRYPFLIHHDGFEKIFCVYKRLARWCLHGATCVFAKDTGISSSVRVVSLTPDGITKKKIISHLIADIFESTVKLCIATDPYGDGILNIS